MEIEVRYFFNEKKMPQLKHILANFQYLFSAHEMTVMYDNPNPDLTFYNAAIDGRLRLRTSETLQDSEFGAPQHNQPNTCLLTWKRRLPESRTGGIRREEEIECEIKAADIQSIKQILNDVLKCPKVSSYERIRHNFESDHSKITLDQFPYGLMLEFELKPAYTEQQLIDEVKRCGLDLSSAAKNSCNDQYFELCQNSGIKPKPDILFDDPDMPKIVD